MLRNYTSAALRNLVRNQPYSGIGIAALSIGLCGTMLAGLTLRNELTYERFIPGYLRTYLAAAVATPAGHAPLYDETSPSFVAELLRLNVPQISSVTRIAPAEVRLQRAQTAAKETIYWADPNVFELLPLPVLAGDLRKALQRPDGIVLSRAIAEKYFGNARPIGQAIVVDGTHAMTVTAVVDDLSVGATTLESGIFASGLATYSMLSKCDREAPGMIRNGGVTLCARTYVQVAPGANIQHLQESIDHFLPRAYPRMAGMTMSVQLIRNDRVHLFDGFNPGIQGRLAAISAVALAILFTACVVFVNLSTARSVHRALEVGVRKACGASRTDIAIQFLGESLLHVAVAACLGYALACFALPHVNAFLNTSGHLDFWNDGALVVAAVAGLLFVGMLAGAYPAFVLSGFRPSSVFKGSVLGPGGGWARTALVVLQFAVLIALLIATMVMHDQRIYATRDALRVDTGQMLILRSTCRSALLNEVRALPGVRGASCSEDAWLDRAAFFTARLRDGTALAIDATTIDFDVLGLYGIRPLAGALPTHEASDSSDVGPLQNSSQVVINETAARRFGFRAPAAAIGQALPLTDGPTSLTGPTDSGKDTWVPKHIVAVVPDFAFDVGMQGIRPAIYLGPEANGPDTLKPANEQFRLVSVKLTGRNIPETLSAIDRISAATSAGDDSLPVRVFLSQYIENLYVAILRETQAMDVFAAVAIALACLGLLGLSAATAARRTREIGIRKALGASSTNILRMLLWQFSKPVAYASLIAWPASAFLLNRWLEGFATHIDLSPLTFVVAAVLALAIALATVATHALKVAHARPVVALRYE